MSRRLLLLPCLALLALLAVPLSGQAAKTRYKTGVSDQQYTSFDHALFTSLGFSTARYIVPYDVMSLAPDDVNRIAFDLWMTNARRRGQDVLLALEHSHTRGNEGRVPNARAYAKQLKLILRAYRGVKSIQ